MVRYVMQGPECRDACGVSWMQVGVKAEKFVCTGTAVDLSCGDCDITASILQLPIIFERVVSAELKDRYHVLHKPNSRHEFLGPQPRRM